jgi:chromosome segregation ATPase
LDINAAWESKLARLRAVDVDLSAARRATDDLHCELEKERELSVSLAEENHDLIEQNLFLSQSLESQRSALADLKSDFESATTRFEREISELSQLRQDETRISSLEEELSNLNTELNRARTVHTQTLAEISTLQTKLSELQESSSSTIFQQQTLINELTNSVSEAAIQIFEAQSRAESSVGREEVEERDMRIRMLEKRQDELHEEISERDDKIQNFEKIISEGKSRIMELQGDLDNITNQNTTLESQLKSSQSHLNLTTAAKEKLLTDLAALPLINARLEADCAFLRTDLATTAAKMKSQIELNDKLTNQLQALDSVLTTEQRTKVSSFIPRKTDSAAVAENKKLLVEAMELRMRIVDLQTARDKAQGIVLEQAQTIAKLENSENLVPNENEDEKSIHAFYQIWWFP